MQTLSPPKDPGIPAILQRGFAPVAARLTGSHRRLAEFLARSYQDAAFLSAAEVGRRTGVSPATVVRFARSLGFRGYPELQRELQAAMKAQMGGLARLHTSAARIAGASWRLQAVVETDIRNLHATLRRIPEEGFRRAVHLLASAPAVHVIGLRSSQSLAQYLGFFLGMLRGHVGCIIPGFGNLPEQLVDVQPGDVVVGITFRSYTQETLRILDALRKARTRLILIADGPVWPLAGAPHLLLPVSTEHPSFLESSVPALALVNGLISGVAAAGRPGTEKRLRRHQALWDSLGTYWVDRTEGREGPVTPAGTLRLGRRRDERRPTGREP